MEPLKDLAKENQNFLDFPGTTVFEKENIKANRCLHHFLAPVVGIQVCGAFSVVCPGSVDAEHLLPVTRCITLAVGPS